MTRDAAIVQEQAIKAMQEKIGWAIFNLGKGNHAAALTLMDKAMQIGDEACGKEPVTRLHRAGGHDAQTPNACWCCGESAPIRGEGDPWEGRLDGYCDSCATTRCDTTDSTCAVKGRAKGFSARVLEQVVGLVEVYGDENLIRLVREATADRFPEPTRDAAISRERRLAAALHSYWISVGFPEWWEDERKQEVEELLRDTTDLLAGVEDADA